MVIAIDLGSNSLRVLLYDCKNNSSVGEFEKTVGTADGLKKSGNISDAAQDRVITALNEAKEKLNFDPLRAIAFTTQAMRVAKNSNAVLENIKKQTGISFSIIDGDREANLTLQAIKYALKREAISNEQFVALDIGGGSSELIIVDGDDEYVKSFPFGIVTLSQSIQRQKDFSSLVDAIHSYLKSLNIDLKNFTFVSTAGTPTTIAAMMHNLSYKTYDKSIVNGTRVAMNNILDVQRYLKSLDEKELEIKVGTGRAHYIDTGIEIFKLFFTMLQKEESIVFDDGLREGIAIDWCRKSQSI